MKIIRILIYEGEPKDLSIQLGSSMPDGTRPGVAGTTIKAITLGAIPDSFSLLESPTQEEEDTTQLRHAAELVIGDYDAYLELLKQGRNPAIRWASLSHLRNALRRKNDHPT